MPGKKEYGHYGAKLLATGNPPRLKAIAKWGRLAALGVLVAIASGAWADDWAPSHHCRKPTKPYRFTSEYEVESFKDEVDAYERCIDEFVRQQQEAAQVHKDAAKRAVDEWNSFVRFELR